MDRIRFGPVLSFRYYLGVLPPRDVKKYYWSALFVLVNIASSALFIWGIKGRDYASDIDGFVDDLGHFIQICVIQITAINDIFNRMRFIELLKNIRKTDDALSNLGTPVSHNVELNLISFYVCLFSTFICTSLDIHGYKHDIRIIVIALSHCFYEILNTSASLVYISLLRAITAQLEAVTKLIKSNDSRVIEKVVFIHERIWTSGQQLNDLLGWNAFGYIVYNFVDSITNCYFIMASTSNENQRYAGPSWVTYRVFHVLQLLSTCSWTSYQFDEFQEKLQGYAICSKSEYNEEYNTVLCYILMKRTIKFDAKGFFSLSCEMFLTAISTSAVYIALLYQTADLC